MFPACHSPFLIRPLFSLFARKSFADLVIAALSKSELPCVLIASKTDVPENLRQVQPRFQEQVRRSFANVAVFETAKGEPESHKRCLLSMLNQHLGVSKGEWRLNSTA
jgi:hypothetical protein